MKYLEVEFLCRLATDAFFSAYKGSMLRGSLGHHLRKGLCMTKKQECPACILAQNCVFQRVFNPLPLNGINRSAPFCLEPDLDSRRNYRAGELFTFKLKLFSYAVDFLPFFVQAFRLAGEKGMGSVREPGKFLIEEIISQGESIYDAGNDNLKLPRPQTLPDLADLSESGEEMQILLHILTPLRHKGNNRFMASLEFMDLFHLVLRRIKALHYLEGTDWNLAQGQYSLLRARAAETVIKGNDLSWHDWTRYSSRQDSFMKFGGLMGKIHYAGKLSIFRNFLRLASIAHLGKQTSFGLGRVEIEFL